jgi:hypothetical protein
VDSHIGGRARCEAEVVGESVAGVGHRRFCGVGVSGGGTGAVALGTDCKLSEEWLEGE